MVRLQEPIRVVAAPELPQAARRLPGKEPVGTDLHLSAVHVLAAEVPGTEPPCKGLDARLERFWAIGDVNGIWPLTHVGEYEGDVVAANILGDARPANYEAVPRVTYTDPQAAAVGAVEAEYSASAPVSEVPKTAT